MNRILLLFSLFCSVGLCAADVRDFGAKGDGVTDDYPAIQRAVDTLSKRIRYQRFRQDKGWYSGSTEAPVEELKFPAGTYRISRTVVADGSIAWRGEPGKTVIIQSDPEADLVYCRIYRRILLNDLQFEGGNRQLHIWSRNWNASSVFINRCVFRKASGAAIENLSRQKTKSPEVMFSKKAVEMIEPCEVSRDETGMPVLRSNDLSGSTDWYSSNLIDVRDSWFDRCGRAWVLDNDGAMFTDCRITVDPGSEGPVIVAGAGPAPNMMTIHNLHAEAPETGKNQYWFQNDGFYLICRNSRFDSKRPMLLVNQDTQRSLYHPLAGSLLIDRCSFRAAGNPSGAVIEVNRLPNILKFTDNTELSGTEAALFKWNVTPTEQLLREDSFRGTHKGTPWDLSIKYSFLIAGNHNIQDNLPPQLKPWSIPDSAALHCEFPRLEAPASPFSGELSAAEYGVRADGTHDDAPALRRAVAEAARQRRTLLLPSGTIHLGSTVELPPECSLRGEGMPVIAGRAEQDYDLFHTPAVGDIRLEGLILRCGDRLFDGVITDESGFLQVKNCVFYDSGPVSFRIRNRSAEVKNSRFRVELAGSLWNGSGAIETDAAMTSGSNLWLANNYFMDDQAMVTVNGGRLVLSGGIYVPYKSKGIRRKNHLTGEEKIWELGRNPRWIDNNGGEVWTIDCRFGGEAGGYCPVRNRLPGGRVHMEGGLARFTYPHTEHCILYLEAPAAEASLIAIGGYPVSQLLGVPQKAVLAAPGVDPGQVEKAGVMAP